MANQKTTPLTLSRAKHLEELAQASHSKHEWDLIVIGGGATGLGAAVDAASRGLRVLLLESHDFAKGSSSRATKLAHGGVRYLARGELGLVREALRERGRMLRNAPNLVTPLAFVIPVRKLFDQMFYWAGLKIYDLLAGNLRVGPTSLMTAAQVIQALPNLQKTDLFGGVRYFDAQFDDAKLAIALMKTLHHLGSMAVNYMPVTGFLKASGRVCGVVAKEHFSGEVFELRAKAVVNATGVWVDEIRRLANPRHKPVLSPSQGIHVVVDQSFYPAREAMLVPHTSDGRVLFVIPWLGKVLIGTTDTPRTNIVHEPNVLPGEVDFILNAVGDCLEKPPALADVRSVFVGLRPLVNQTQDPSVKSKTISREHTLVVDSSGLFSIAGGKWTTYRSMAEELINLVVKQHRMPVGESQTRTLRLQDDLPDATQPSIHPRIQLSVHEIYKAATCEMAVTIEDVLARRNRALFLDSAAALDCVNTVAQVLQQVLNLSDEQIDKQKQDFLKLQKQYCL